MNEVIDLVIVRLHNVPKLVTKEDFFHLHKLIGIASMIHYIYRFYLVLTTRSMNFDNSLWTLGAILLHSTLSVSSLIFKIPEKRIRSGPMIYPEFRLHSIIFALRSLFTMALMYFSRRYALSFPLYFRGAIVLITMVFADIVTKSYRDQGTTMRSMPFPQYVSQKTRDTINTYYSISQIFATSQILFAHSLDEPFLVLFPIQMAAFLMTCVRKSIISPGAWHVYYALSLGLNYMWNPFMNLSRGVEGGFFFPVAIAVIIIRFCLPSINKYAIWSAAIFMHVIAMAYFHRYDKVLV
eukprot:gene4732-9400_t